MFCIRNPTGRMSRPRKRIKLLLKFSVDKVILQVSCHLIYSFRMRMENSKTWIYYNFESSRRHFSAPIIVFRAILFSFRNYPRQILIKWIFFPQRLPYYTIYSGTPNWMSTYFLRDIIQSSIKSAKNLALFMRNKKATYTGYLWIAKMSQPPL